MGPIKTVKIQGGIGNQLFGLAFAHSLATLSGERVALDIASYDGDHYGHRFVLAELAQSLGFEICRRPWLANRFTSALLSRLPAPGYHAEARAPGGLEALAARQGYFDGYWQDAAWIARPDIFRDAARRLILSRAGEGDEPRPEVVLHFRTYSDEVRPDRRGVPDAAWVRRAFGVVETALGRAASVTLVSDDPVLALDRLSGLGRPIVMSEERDPWVDLQTLIRAEALILTNSSFSWWGGFCSEASTIVYPARSGFHHYPAPHPRFTVL